MPPLSILHCHSTFSLDGKEVRAVRLMNAWGEQARHTVLSATDQLAAREAIAAGIALDFPHDAPSLAGRPGIARYRTLARYMARFELVLSYNRGAMDAAMARRLLGGPPLVHHEDGFNADKAERQQARRVWFRRLGLDAVAAPPLNVRLVIVGEGPERARLEARAAPLGRRVRFAGFRACPWDYAGTFDALALSSLSEQAPIAVIERMVAGRGRDRGGRRGGDGGARRCALRGAGAGARRGAARTGVRSGAAPHDRRRTTAPGRARPMTSARQSRPMPRCTMRRRGAPACSHMHFRHET